MRRVVITGMGVISSTGKNRDHFFQSLIDSSHGDEPSLWAIGLGDGGEHDGFGRRH